MRSVGASVATASRPCIYEQCRHVEAAPRKLETFLFLFSFFLFRQLRTENDTAHATRNAPHVTGGPRLFRVHSRSCACSV